MSAYENIVGGKLKLKGKALDVKAAGMKKKKKKLKKLQDQESLNAENDLPTGGFSFFCSSLALFCSFLSKLIRKISIIVIAITSA